MHCKVHSPRGTQFLCNVPMLPAFGLPSVATPPIPPSLRGWPSVGLRLAHRHRYGRAESSPASGAPSAGLGGGDGFVIDHENAGLNKPLIVFVANDLIPYSANVPLEGSTGRIEAFSVLLAYDP